MGLLACAKRGPFGKPCMRGAGHEAIVHRDDWGREWIDPPVTAAKPAGWVAPPPVAQTAERLRERLAALGRVHEAIAEAIREAPSLDEALRIALLGIRVNKAILQGGAR